MDDINNVDEMNDLNDDYEPPQLLNPAHELLERVQKALTEQLSKGNDRVSAELREQKEALRKAKVSKENVGVELYEVQQQLAKLQMQLEKTHDHLKILINVRMESEEDLKQIDSGYQERKADLHMQRQKLAKFQAELDQLNSTLRQVEQYNDQMKSEISVTRRATYKAEENVVNLEKNKKSQDILIDSLNEQLKHLHEQLALYEAQLVSQRQETKAAAETLAEAAAEMDAINFEKKQLLQQWKSSLIGMARRDEALQATEEALRKQREQGLAIDNETEGYKKSIKKEQERNELLTGVLSKVQTEASFLDKQIDEIKERRYKLNEKFTLLKKSLEQTESEMTKAQQVHHMVKGETATCEKMIQKVSQEVVKIEETIVENLSTQTTIEKSAQSTAQSAKRLREAIHDKDIQAGQLENELARIRVDALNTASHNQQLEITLKDLLKELKEKDTLIEKYEIEIKRRNDQIEKKQYEVDRLNRKYDQLVSNMEDENLGPLEATIYNMTKQIATKAEENAEHQRRWIKDQTELVSLQNENQHLTDSTQELKAQDMILTQKKLRIDSDFVQTHGEMKSLETGVKNMHTEMAKMNELISRNSALQEKLADANFNMETEFVKKLKEKEDQANGIEGQIANIKQQKQDILENIVEAERQIMQWERKIQLEKETQATLDPTVGEMEAQSMRNEIHRMKLRYEQLLRKQQVMIADMEKAVMKRELIATKGRASSQRSNVVTQADVKRKVDDLSKKIKFKEGNVRVYDEQISQLEEQRDRIVNEYSQANDGLDDLKGQEQEQQQDVERLIAEKHKNLENIHKSQRMIKKYNQLAEGNYEMENPDSEMPGLMEDAQNVTGALHDVLDQLRGAVAEDDVRVRIERLLGMFE